MQCWTITVTESPVGVTGITQAAIIVREITGEDMHARALHQRMKEPCCDN